MEHKSESITRPDNVNNVNAGEAQKHASCKTGTITL